MFAFCGSSFNFNTSFLIVLAAVSDSRTRFIARDQSDLVTISVMLLPLVSFYRKQLWRSNIILGIIWAVWFESSWSNEKSKMAAPIYSFVKSNNSKVFYANNIFSLKIMASFRWLLRENIDRVTHIIHCSTDHNRNRLVKFKIELNSMGKWLTANRG